jgi:hypothetical protein
VVNERSTVNVLITAAAAKHNSSATACREASRKITM